MHGKVYRIILSLFLIIFSFQSNDRTILNEAIDNKILEYYDKKEFNGTVLVAHKGEVLFQKGYGYADVSHEILNGPQTKFSIGSTTKSFTAIAIIQQVVNGNLNLHSPISKYVPELNAEIGQLTLHQLMKNISGLPVHLNRITDLEYRDISSNELIDLYNTINLSFPPGEQFEYSNLNYQLCSIVLERITGMTYEEYLTEHIFNVCGMNNTGVESR